MNEIRRIVVSWKLNLATAAARTAGLWRPLSISCTRVNRENHEGGIASLKPLRRFDGGGGQVVEVVVAMVCCDL